jgi:very-short-patch-repair endonuclease
VPEDFLFSPRGRDWLIEYYVHKRQSTYELADVQGTYPNRIRRALLHHDIPLRDRSDALRAALKSGRHAHPTKGKRREGDVKHKIGVAVAAKWQALDPKDRQERSAMGRCQWQAMPERQREWLRQAAAEGMRRAAKEGSKLERHLFTGLAALGYAPRLHADVPCSEGPTQVDLLVHTPRAAIEVDGPSHFLPIWGEERLAEVISSDILKTGLLIQAGYAVLRIKHLTKSLSKVRQQRALDTVVAELAHIAKDFPPPERRLIQLEA